MASDEVNDLWIYRIISKIKPFRYLEENEMFWVKSFGKVIDFKEHSVILQQGNVGDGLYVILKGEVKVTIRRLSKNTLSLAQYQIGSFFGEANLLTTAPCTASIITTSPTTCFFFPKICFDSFAVGLQSIRYRIIKALTEDVVQRYRVMNKDLQKLLIKGHVASNKIEQGLQPSLHGLVGLPAPNARHFFTNEELTDLKNHTTLLSCENPSWLIRANQHSTACYFVLNGAVSVSIVNDTKRSHFVVHPPHTLICPVSFIDQQREIFSYLTCGKAQILEFNPDYLQEIRTNHQELWFKCYELFSHYIFSLQKRLNNQLNRLTNEKD